MRTGRVASSIAFIVAGTALGVLAASAADIPAKAKAAPAAPAYTVADWSGFYLGGHAGWGAALSRGTYDDVDDNPPIDFGDTGFLYGVQGGYNWQFGSIVSGVEIDGTWGSLESNRTDNNGDQQRMKTDFLASARLRSGAAIDNIWIYGTIGIGYAQSKFTVTGSDSPSPASRDLNGFGIVSGFGAEYAIAPNWSLRAEYLYYAISKRDGLPNLTNDSDPNDFAKIDGIHVARIAASYRFNGTQARVPASTMDWSGFYVGAHGGYGRSRMTGVYDEAGDSGAFDIDPVGGVGGLQAGYNIQRGAWVYGVEADGSWSGMKDDRVDNEGDTQTLKTTALASLRGRVGVVAENRLYYVTGGWGMVKSKLSVNEAGTGFGTNLTSNGPVFGSGVDWAFSPNWSARIEGLTYLNDKKRALPSLTPDSDAQDFVRQDLVTVLRVGVNYRFGGP